MTPLDLAQNLAGSALLKDRALGIAIVTRSLTDDDPTTHRQGWPLDATTVVMAARHLGIKPNPVLIEATLAIAPKISDAMLNRQAQP